MPQRDQAFRSRLHNSELYSSLTGLEMAVPPRRSQNVSETTSRYTHKPLPSLPLAHRSLSKNGAWGYVHARDSPTRRPSTSIVVDVRLNRRKSSSKIKQLTGRSKDVGSKQGMEGYVKGGGVEAVDRSPLFGSKFMRITESDDGLASRITSHMNDVKWSDPAFSVSSLSVYSDEDDVEDVIDSYSTGVAKSSIEQPRLSEANPGLYLQSGRHFASANELGYLSSSVDSSLPVRSINRGDPPINAVTLDTLIQGERERSEAFSSQNNSMKVNDNVEKNDDRLAPVDSNELPSWNDYDKIIRHMTIPPPVLRPKKYEGPGCWNSRFSDQSSESEANAEVVSTARDSVITHIRNIPKTFNPPSRSSVVFKEKAAISSISVPPVEKVARERRLFSGKHPLKSPFPFSPLRKKACIDDFQTPERLGLVHRLSDAFSYRVSGSPKSPNVSSVVISNYARASNGPETPMPTKSEALGVMSPTSVFHKGVLQLRDVIGRAKRTANIRSKDEKRRDHLRNQIVVMGVMEEAPGDQWI